MMKQNFRIDAVLVEKVAGTDAKTFQRSFLSEVSATSLIWRDAILSWIFLWCGPWGPEREVRGAVVRKEGDLGALAKPSLHFLN